MTTLRESIVIKRTPQHVFAYLSDFSSCQEWDPGVISAHRTSTGPLGVGSTFHVVCALPVGSIELEYEILEFVPDEKLVLVGRSRFFDVTDTITLGESAQGCELEYTAVFDFNAAVGLMAASMEAGLQRMGHESVQVGLKAALEDNYRAPALSRENERSDRFLPSALSLFSRRGYRRGRANWNPVSAYMGDKHVLITGATAGLGRAAASAIAAKGARLTLVVRDADKGAQLRQELELESGNTKIEIEVADLALMRDVDDLVRRLRKKKTAIDVLVNNAGALFNPRGETDEGLEQSFALLLLGPYRLTEGLYPLLKLSKGARVINVVSGGMYSQKVRVDDLQNELGKYSGSVAYARAKRALMIKTEQWAEDWAADNIVVNAMHPGWADTPGVRSALPEFHRLTRRILRTPEEGADTIVWLACATEAARATGKLFLDREPRKTHLVKSTRESATEREALREALANWPVAKRARRSRKTPAQGDHGSMALSV